MMTKYREILRLHSQGISSRNITVSLGCSRNTIRAVLARATEGVIWPLPDEMTDRVLEQTLPRSHGMDLTFGDLDLFSWTHGSISMDRRIFFAGIYISSSLNKGRLYGRLTISIKEKIRYEQSQFYID